MENLRLITKKSLLRMINELEHYPAVTNKDDKAYILSYLEDEACSINKEEIINYFKNLTDKISQDYTKFCYHYSWDEFLSQYDLSEKDFNNIRKLLR